MDMGKYLLSLVTAAILCGIATSLLGNKGALGTAVKLLAGIYMTLSIVAPWGQLRLGELSELKDQITADGERITVSGQNAAREAMAESIIASTRTYILDKAKALGAEITIDFSFDEDLLPVFAEIYTEADSSVQKQLQDILTTDLGIPKERQTWISCQENNSS